MNLWPPPCKGGAQPTELTAHDLRTLTRYVRQRQAAERGSGSIPVFFSVAGRRLLPGIRAGSRAQRVAGGRGLRSPSPPTTPYPALGQPSLTDSLLVGSVPLPPCRAAAGVRTPAVPHSAGQASVRRRSFRPCGAAISSAPCPAYAGKAVSSFLPTNDNPPLMQGRKNSFPPINSAHCAGESLTTGERSFPLMTDVLFSTAERNCFRRSEASGRNEPVPHRFAV